MTSIILCSYPIIKSFNFSSLTLKSYKISSHGLVASLANYRFLYSLYFINLFY